MSNLTAILHDLLGVKPKRTEPTLTLAYSVQKGLPVSALDRVAGRVSPNDVRRFTYRVVPKPTLERRRRDKKPLTRTRATGWRVSQRCSPSARSVR